MIPTQQLRATTLVAGLLALCNPTAAQAAPETLTQSVTYNGQTVTMQLTKSQLRGANFEVLLQDDNGVFNTLTAPEERSYMGSVVEYPGALASGIIKDNGEFWGAIFFDRGRTWRTLGNQVYKTRGDFDFVWFKNGAYTVAPNNMGPDNFAFDLGIDGNWKWFNWCVNQDSARALETVEYSTTLLKALYVSNAQLRPYLGRIIFRSGDLYDPTYYSTSDNQSISWMTNDWYANHSSTNFDFVANITQSVWANSLGGGRFTYNAAEADGDFYHTLRHELGHCWTLGHGDGGEPEGGTINSGGWGGGNVFSRFSGPELAKLLYSRYIRNDVSLTNEGTFDVNVPPYAALDLGVFERTLDESLTFNVLANDHDANGHTIQLDTYDPVSAQGGTITPQGANLIYTPPANNYLGTDWFLYTIIDSSGQTATGAVVIDIKLFERLRQYLPLDETSGSVAYDIAPAGLNGYLQAGTSFDTGSTTGKFGQALDLDGVDDYFIFNDQFMGDLKDCTIAMWVKLDSITPWSRLLDVGNTTSYLNLIPLNGATGGVSFAITTGGYYAEQKITGANPLPTGVWTHVAVTLQGGTGILYVNGVEVGRNSSMNLTPASLGYTTSNFVGKSQYANPTLDGQIDDVRIYRAALDASEIANASVGAIAENPLPFNGSIDRPTIGFPLQWVKGSGDEADVYLGTDENAVLTASTSSSEYQGRQSTVGFNPGELAPFTEYFWRIDTVVDGTTTVPGQVWKFTTGASTGHVMSWNANYWGRAYDDQSTNVSGLTLATYWNDSSKDGRTVDLLTDTGAASTIDISTVDGGYGNHSMIASSPAVDTDGSFNKRILNGYVNAPSSKVILTEIAYPSYDVIVYFSSDKTGATGNVTDGTTTYYFNTLGPASISGGNAQFVEATDTTTAGHGVGANYAVFSGLSGASQTFTANIPLWGGIAAVQVVYNAPPPTWTAVIYDDFEAGFGNWIDGGSDCQILTNSSLAAQGNNSLNLQDDTSTSVASTANLALSGYSEVKVDFAYTCRSMDNSSEGFWLQISTDGGNTYTTVKDWYLNADFANDQFYTDSVTISGYALNNQTRLRFHCDASGNADDVFIDTVQVSAK